MLYAGMLMNYDGMKPKIINILLIENLLQKPIVVVDICLNFTYSSYTRIHLNITSHLCY